MDDAKAGTSCQDLTPLERTQFLNTTLDLIAQAKEQFPPTTKDLFSSLSEDEIRTLLNNANTPYIYFQSWSANAPAGGTISYNCGIFNPDPVNRIWMYAHVFVGPANPVPDTGIALLNVDTRFPRMTEPSFTGLTLAPGGSATLSFQYPIPLGIQNSNYLGNNFLFHGEYHGIGTYYFRCLFPFHVP
ncbi:MAG: hypothetical protein JST22_20420 [Bacteroidetes bacterium]|nr:hypothetical protein [Bacteroidota bacterium]